VGRAGLSVLPSRRQSRWPSRYEAAIEEAEHAVELNPSNAFAFGALAHALDAVGRHDAAAALARKTINMRTDYPALHYILASALGALAAHHDAAKNEHLHAGVRAAQAKP